MTIGTLVRVKEEYAFDIPTNYHYGEVVETNIDAFGNNEIRIKSNLRYIHDSFTWTLEKFYETLKCS